MWLLIFHLPFSAPIWLSGWERGDREPKSVHQNIDLMVSWRPLSHLFRILEPIPEAMASL
jgi:hypothetical protein